mmetsp:Transcript_9039/g.13343  ORF Transcript_9039/g.13343 Transcript_9039/m.13343 type:complete len:344 (-) Transcript_9039:100-1131(-)
MINSGSSNSLRNRQASLPIEGPNDDEEHVDSTSELLGHDLSITLKSATNSSDNSKEENIPIFGHVMLSFLFLLGGTSIVPLSAAAKDEAWRTENIPYQTIAAGDVILNFELNHPLVDPPTVDSNMLIGTSVIVPFLIVLCINLFSMLEWKRTHLAKKHRLELRSSLCALFTSLGLSETITCILKVYVSRHRPNFYALCGFDVETLECAAPSLEDIHEATLSFPSGHSSLSFCGMTYLVLFFLGRVVRITSRTTLTLPLLRKEIQLESYKQILGALSCIVPWSYALFVATSRIVDKWHHPSDVIAGSLLGIVCAIIGYHIFFYSVLSANGKVGMPLSLQSLLTV